METLEGTVESNPTLGTTAPVQDVEVADTTTYDEKLALTNYSNNINSFLTKLEELNGQAAKRVLMGICSPGINWTLHKHTTDLEKEVFYLAAKLMDSKILMMLADLDKQVDMKNSALAAAANNADAEVSNTNDNKEENQNGSQA